MAGVYAVAQVGVTALVGAAAQTIIAIAAPTNQRIRILMVYLSFDGTNSANTPASITVSRTSGGTYTNAAVAPVKLNDLTAVAETIQSTYKTVCTVQPTIGDIIGRFTIPVFGGTVINPFPPGQEDMVPGGSQYGITVTAAQGVNVQCTVRFEE